MGLQISFPSERNLYFQAIETCHNASTRPEMSQEEKKFYSTLAHRMITKAASAVPQDERLVCSCFLETR